ncbi:MAG: WYL domain-containing protein [Thermoplasmata archaeon]
MKPSVLCREISAMDVDAGALRRALRRLHPFEGAVGVQAESEFLLLWVTTSTGSALSFTARLGGSIGHGSTYGISPSERNRVAASLPLSGKVRLRFTDRVEIGSFGRLAQTVPPPPDLRLQDIAPEGAPGIDLTGPGAVAALLEGLGESADSAVAEVRIAPGTATIVVVEDGTARRTVTLGAGAHVPAQVQAAAPVRITIALRALRECLTPEDDWAHLWISPERELRILSGDADGLVLASIGRRQEPPNATSAFSVVASLSLPPVPRTRAEPEEDGSVRPETPEPGGSGWLGALPDDLRAVVRDRWADLRRRVDPFWPPESAADPAPDASPQGLVRARSDPRSLGMVYLAFHGRFPEITESLDAALDRRSRGREPLVLWARPNRAEEHAAIELWRDYALAETHEGGPDPFGEFGSQRIKVAPEVVAALRAVRDSLPTLRWLGLGLGAPESAVLGFPAGPHLPLGLVMAAIERGRLRVTQGGRAHKLDRDRSSELWHLSRPEWIDALLSVAQRSGLVERRGGRIVAVPGWIRFFDATPHAASEEILRAFAPARTNLARAALYQEVLEIPPERWCLVGALVAAARGRRRRAGITASDISAGFAREALEVLVVAGILEWAEGPYGPTVRPLPGSREILLRLAGADPIRAPEAAPIAAVEPSARVLPTFELHMPADRWIGSDSVMILRSGELLGRDRVVSLRFTPASVEEAARRGISSNALVEYLQARTGRPLPPTVRSQILSWGAGKEPITLGLDLAFRGSPEALRREGLDPDHPRPEAPPDHLVAHLQAQEQEDELFRRETQWTTSSGEPLTGFVLTRIEMEFLAHELRYLSGSAAPRPLWPLVHFLQTGARGRRRPPGSLGERELDPIPLTAPSPAPEAPPSLREILPSAEEATPPSPEFGEAEIRLNRAIHLNEVLRIVVTRSPSAPGTTHTVSPHGLFRRNDATYLVGTDHATRALMLFRTSRLSSSTPLLISYHEADPDELERFVEAHDLEPVGEM